MPTLLVIDDEEVVPVYAGDSDNDAEAIEAAAALGDLSVGVGPFAPSALHHVRDPGALVAFHTGLADRLGI